MAYEPLHHKYRPQTFAELVGQGAIAQTLSNALNQQRIAPAYLFTGARGTGKTSSARIFAKSLNCLNHPAPTEQPCGQCEVCRAIANGSALDVIEIDAASNTGVDNIRELIERAQFAPVQCRYKVYIIDEVHMLSTAAFNALLKTLEEPPPRVVFILATTDPQRVLPTIISRCQRFDFRRIPLADLVAHLRTIATQEAIAITPEALLIVAQMAQGGLRDAESMLDQLSLLQGEITVERVWDLVGAVPERELLQLVQAIAQDNPALVLDAVRALMDRGREPLIVLQYLASFYRDLLIAQTAPDRHDLVAITPPTWAEMCAFVQQVNREWITAGQQHLRTSEVQIKQASQPRLWLEVTLMGLLPSAQQVGNTTSTPLRSVPVVPVQKTAPPATSSTTSTPIPSATAATAKPPASPPAQPVPAEVSSEPSSPLAPEVAPSVTSIPAASTPTEPFDEVAASHASDLHAIWQQIIDDLHPLSKALLRDHGRLLELQETRAEIGISSQNLFKIAQERLPHVEEAFRKVLGRSIKVQLVIAPPSKPTPAVAAHRHTSDSPEGAGSASPLNDRGAASSTASPPATPPTHPRREQSASGTPPAKQSPPSPPPTPPADLPTNLQPQWQDEDEVTRAAKSLAQMFNGQIVNLEGELEPVEPIADVLTDLPDESAIDVREMTSSGDELDDNEVPF
jgi:DNA polymerase-3 subunit gamma/tau